MTDIKKGEHNSPQIKYTTDYGMFKYIPSNRPVQKVHVQELVVSFQDNPDLVDLRPILINEKDEIIDGQHRLQACEALKIAVPYIMFPGLTVETAQLMNATQRPWAFMEYAHSYAESGKKQYQDFLRLLEDYAIQPTVLLQYIYNSHQKHQHKDFKRGRLVEIDMVRVSKELDELDRFSKFINWGYSTPFSRAFFKVHKIEGVDVDKLIENYAKIKPVEHTRLMEYVRDFETAYNLGRKGELIRFQ